MNIALQHLSYDTPFHIPLDAETEKPTFETLVENYYSALYRFAFSLSQNEAEACDLTQQTFYLWAKKGHQLRNPSKAKSWLFTTLHHSYLGSRRRTNRFPHYEITTVTDQLPNISPNIVNQMDSSAVLQSLMQIDELHRIPLILFYLENHSYLEIAKFLNIKIGTVMSRLARGKKQLRQILTHKNKNHIGKLYF